MLSDPSDFLPHTPHPEHALFRTCHVLKSHYLMRATPPKRSPSRVSRPASTVCCVCHVLKAHGFVLLVPSFRALSGRLKFTVRRHKFNKGSLSLQSGSQWSEDCAPHPEHAPFQTCHVLKAHPFASVTSLQRACSQPESQWSEDCVDLDDWVPKGDMTGGLTDPLFNRPAHPTPYTLHPTP